MSTSRFSAFAGSAAMSLPIALQNIEQVEAALASNPDAQCLAAAVETLRDTRILLNNTMRVADDAPEYE